ncbi:22287_t:CDS:2, partial [Rhizophagus irregularis]
IKPPSDWKTFFEIGFKVSNIHTEVTVGEIKGVFATYGSVYRAKIVTREVDDSENPERSTGTAYILFKPVPPRPFWNESLRLHGRVLRIDYRNDFRSSDSFYSYPAESLELGDYILPNIFVSEAKFTQSVKFFISYQNRKIIVELKYGEPMYTFKLEFNFDDIINDIYSELDVSQQRSHGSITIENKYPAKCWVLHKCQKPKDKFNWCIDNFWNRITKNDKMPHFHKDNDQPGKWLVFRITFDLDQIGGLNRFKKLIEKAGEYNLAPRTSSISNFPLKIINGTELCKHFVNRKMLNFKVNYMLECNISFNYLNEYNLCKEFYSLLSQQPTKVSLNILEGIHSKKKRIYKPLPYLRSELEKLKYKLVNESTYIPYYCVMVRKVIVTPTTSYILTPTMETSNRVIRHFLDKKDHFLRVKFVDEALSKVSCSPNGVTNDTPNLALYNRVYYTLCHGITIGGRKYEFLAFSESQLRDHSCWFFSSIGDLTADKVRTEMGIFSTNKSVAKYIAQMDQCFSSTRNIQMDQMDRCFSSTRNIKKPPIVKIKEIPDIVRNGFTFSDGVGNISFSLAKKIAYDFKLKTIPSAIQFRMAGYKGVLCQSNNVKDNEVQVRPSQHKFESHHNDLEVIRGSTFISAYLNHQAITFLSALGIPDKVFIELKDLQVRELDKMLENEHTALNILQRNVDEYGISISLAELVKAGFLRNKDRYLMNLISLFRTKMLRDIKKKAKIRVDKGAFLLGVLDVTETLQENQIYCCVSDPCNPSSRKIITGRCIVFRNPCFHPGDIRIVTAVECKALSHLVDVVVFPAVGYRDIPSGGDLDGDDFTVIYDERLIPPKMCEPMDYQQAQIPRIVDIEDIKKFFANYIFSNKIDMIAKNYLSIADSFKVGALHGQCRRIAQIYSNAVNFPDAPPVFPSELRAIDFPDFMEESGEESYKSRKVLGILYRSINVSEEYTPQTNLNVDQRLYEGFLDYVRKLLKREYDASIYYFSETFPWIANDILCDIADRNESNRRALMDLLGPW